MGTSTKTLESEKNGNRTNQSLYSKKFVYRNAWGPWEALADQGPNLKKGPNRPQAPSRRLGP